MRADILLSRLDKVRQTGVNSWIACCPAHQDRHPSMTIREVDERTLIHCFAECSPEEILSAVGLTFDALFPERTKDHRQKPMRRPFPAADVLEALASESLIVATAAGNIGQGVALAEQDRERLITAAARIERGRALANG